MQVITLTSHDNAVAEILPELGFNCFRFRAVRPEDDAAPVTPGPGSLEVLWASHDFSTGEGSPSGSGIPILFPFPGRIRGTDFQWKGRKYSVRNTTDALGNAIHGFVHNRPWRVIRQGRRSVTGQFQASVDDPTILDQWPSDFCLTARYLLGDQSLRLEMTMENPGDVDLPCGLGFHPYFNVPLTSKEDPDPVQAARCKVTVPFARQVAMQEMLPTGESTENRSLVDGMAFGEMQFDDIFTDPTTRGDTIEAKIHHPLAKTNTIVAFDVAFPYCVVYNPGHREAVCIEPYSLLPNAYELESEGVDTNRWTLAPGQKIETFMEISVVPA